MKSKKPEPLEAVRGIFADPKTAASLLSELLGEPTRALEILAMPPEHEPVYPDLVIQHDDRYFIFGFFAKGDYLDIACEMMISQSSAALELRILPTMPDAVAVWVGDSMVDFDVRLDEPNVKYNCPIVDIREEFGAASTLGPVEREVLGKLKTVDRAYGGLFKRLLELPPEQRQREFVRIAGSLGYHALALRVMP